MLSFTGNYIFSYRDPDKILQECKDDLPPDLIGQLKRLLNHYNFTNFVGHVTTEQRRQVRNYDSHASVENNIPKVEHTLHKEECN